MIEERTVTLWEKIQVIKSIRVYTITRQSLFLGRTTRQDNPIYTSGVLRTRTDPVNVTADSSATKTGLSIFKRYK